MESARSYVTKTEIVNESTLPKDRLAEAKAAKAALAEETSSKLLQEALDLAPDSPRCLYWLAQTNVRAKAPGKGADYDPTKIEMDYSQAMPYLERAIKADPKFLPAHYALAMMQPTTEERIAALEEIAKLDPDNAQPYFLMAIETWKQISAGKKMAADSNNSAYDISLADWERVSALLEKVNASKTFAWRTCSMPSVKDITVSTNGKVWPAKAVESTVALNTGMNWTKLGGSQYAPDSAVVSSANGIVRQFARQAVWAANAAHKEKNTDQALHFLDTVREFGGKYSAHEPYALVPFLTGYAVRGIAAETETKLIQDVGGKEDLLKAVNDETAKWKEALGLCDDLTKKGLVTVNDVTVSPGEKLQYSDFEAERAGAKTVLTKAGIIH